MRCKRILVGLCMWAVLAWPPLVQAQSMNDALTNMFSSWGVGITSPPGAYESQRRGYFSGGGVSVRLWQDPMRLWSIAPPRLSVGCQGIDVYLGSFSYGKLDRYVQLLQQIGTGAVLGYAFQLAMKAICEDCADVLNKIEAAARALNAAGRIQPCQTGIELGKALAGNEASKQKLASRFGDAWQKMKEAGGAIGDVFEDRDAVKNQSNADAASALKGTEYDVTGNLVWDVLTQAGLDQNLIAMVMSVTGTVIVGNDGDVQTRDPTMTFEQLVDSHLGDVVKIFNCGGDSECLNPTITDATDIEGFESRVYTSMSNLIEDLYSGSAISAADQQIINMTPVPILTMLADYGRPRDVGNQIARLSSEVVAADMGYQWVKWAATETSRNVSYIQKVKPEWPGNLQDFQGRLHQVLRGASDSLAKRQRMVNNINQLMQLTKTQGEMRSLR